MSRQCTLTDNNSNDTYQDVILAYPLSLRLYLDNTLSNNTTLLIDCKAITPSNYHALLELYQIVESNLPASGYNIRRQVYLFYR